MMQKDKPFFSIIKIKSSDAEYLDEIAELEKILIPCPWSRNVFDIEVKKENSIILGAVFNEKIVGYLTADTVLDEVNLTNIAVSEEYQNNGIAQKLFSSLIENLNEQKYIFLEVRESNIIARTLYKKLCFEEIGIRRNFYEKPVENAVLMKYTIKE